jgi:hypothetical protein
VSLYRMLPLRIIRKYEEYQMGLRCIREEKIRSR